MIIEGREKLHWPAEGAHADGDQRKSISFDQSQDLTRQFDQVLNADIKSIQCVHLPVQNTTNHAILILYLLQRGINLFISSATQFSRSPSFCDKILLLPAATEDPLTAVRLLDNPEFVCNKQSIKPSAGYVVLSSSGSTGAPRFICFRSENLVQNAANCVAHFGWNKQTRILIPVPIHHAYGLGVGLLPAFLSGADFLLIDKNNILKLYAQLSDFYPDVSLVTPAVCKMILLLKKRKKHQTMFITAGELISHTTQADFEKQEGLLLNLYGSTELGAMAVASMDNEEDRYAGLVEPFEGVQVKIDRTGAGEILCRHNAGFDFYLDNAGIPLPLQSDGGWHRTRDFGEMSGPGLKVMGRIDHCTNRLGLLISFQQIEMMLERLVDNINQVVVFETKDQTLIGAVLVAVFEVKGDAAPDLLHIISQACKTNLPRHFIPDEIHIVNELQRLPNGKADRTAVKEYFQTTHL